MYNFTKLNINIVNHADSSYTIFHIIDKDTFGSLSNKENQLIAAILKQTDGFQAAFLESLILNYNSEHSRDILLSIDTVEEFYNNQEECAAVKWQRVGAKIADIASELKLTNIAISLSLLDEGIKKNINDILSSLLLGLGQKIYRFTKYITDEKKIKWPMSQKNIAILEEFDHKYLPYIYNCLESIYNVRDLVNEPANILYPESFANIVSQDLGSVSNIEIEVWDDKQLEKLGANTMLAVAKGSEKSARLVIIKYSGRESEINDIAIVGKGVTFDSGGLSLKPADFMEDMKGDMAGAATAFAAIKLLAKRKAKINAIAVLGLVENMPSSRATKPGDIISSLSGKTIEILNTDAEGRLLLADVLYYTQTRFKPNTIIDLATLTGAIVIALGSNIAGFYSNSEALSDAIKKHGYLTGDLCWRMPLGKKYDRMMDSKIADIKNISGTREAGSITAATFLQRFIADNKNWAHIDIAGVSDSTKSKDLHVSGPSGFGVKLLDSLIYEMEKNM
jgi:leucyl aminopeptidase